MKKPAHMTPHRQISKPNMGPHGQKRHLCPTPSQAPLRQQRACRTNGRGRSPASTSHGRRSTTAAAPVARTAAPRGAARGGRAARGAPAGRGSGGSASQRQKYRHAERESLPFTLPFGGVGPNGSFSRSRRVRGSRGPGLEGLQPRLRSARMKRVQKYQSRSKLPKDLQVHFD